MQAKKLLAGLLFWSITATAQNKGVGTDARNNVKLYLTSNYFQIDALPFKLAFEHKIRSRQSIQLGLAPVIDTYRGIDKRGIVLNAEYRFYVYKNNPGISGSYVGPVVQAAFQKSNNGDGIVFEKNTRRIKSISGGAQLGHQWVWKKGISVDLNVAAGLYHSRTKGQYITGESFSYSDNAFHLGYNIGIGYAFGGKSKKE